MPLCSFAGSSSDEECNDAMKSKFFRGSIHASALDTTLPYLGLSRVDRHHGRSSRRNAANPQRTLRIAKLKHAGAWNVAPRRSPSRVDIPARTNPINDRSQE